MPELNDSTTQLIVIVTQLSSHHSERRAARAGKSRLAGVFHAGAGIGSTMTRRIRK